MYYVRDIEVKFGDRTLLDSVSFMITPKDRIGLIGKNGAGKSTLLKIIAGHNIPDGGSIEFPTLTTIGYLRQEFELLDSRSIKEETMSCFTEEIQVHKKIHDINQKLGEITEYESAHYHALIKELGELTSLAEHINIAKIEIETTKILKGLGFKEEVLNNQVSTLSGGWKMRIELAKLLLKQPDILMLDEPTNHLDIESIIWLENYLTQYNGTVILISHDTIFLENICNRIIEIEHGKIADYRLPYKKYVEEKAKQITILKSAFENQQKEIAQKEKTINRFMAKATKTKMAQSMQKQLEKVERIEVPTSDNKSINIQFTEVPRSGRDVIIVENISKTFGSNNVLNQVSLHIERGDRLAFIGQNGQGKTTLAKIIVGTLSYDQGEIQKGSNVHLSYYAQNQSDLLDLKKTVLETMEEKAPEDMRTKVRAILGAFLFSGGDVDKKVSVLSGGERARLAMASLMMRPCNLLVLDEPTNHLDIHTKEILRQALLQYNGTLIIISHDRAFLRGLSNKVLEFREKKIFEYLGDIEYFLQKRSINNIREIDIPKLELPSNIQSDNLISNKKLSSEEERRIKKTISGIERDILKLEGQITEIEQLMASPEYYVHSDPASISKNYNELKTLLDNKTIEWEQNIELLGDL